MNQIIEWSKGNPGALTFLMTLQMEGGPAALPIIEKLTEAKSIRGTNLYVLWSDLCYKDIEKVAMLCNNCPTKILEDACNRQDYSGRNLIAKYL